MLREALFAKIHHARVTGCRPDYSGSITIDALLLEATGLLPNEKVLIADCENGHRFETYILEGEKGSGVITINGAAALLTGVGHRIIVLAFCQLTREEMKAHHPCVVVCNEKNQVAERFTYSGA